MGLRRRVVRFLRWSSAVLADLAAELDGQQLVTIEELERAAAEPDEDCGWCAPAFVLEE
jgi:xanthine dehydrogenase iron-sulfur cluster and FAD-binding subunit A